MTIAERYAQVLDQVEAACALAGRPPDAVRLVAVSKTRTVAEIEAAVAAGVTDLGENYAQEFRDKARAVEASVRWHFIGRLQRNKVKYVAGKASLFHAMESLSLADEFEKRCPQPQPVLVAVNTGGEETKGGVSPEEALGICEALDAHPGVELRGLMTLPPFREDPEDVAPFFALLAELAAEGRRRGLPTEELSMGMSHDFAVAIRHGATLVRVGTAIFGPRL
jgi:pyridoxal phosphate enzyme (YggS family)